MAVEDVLLLVPLPTCYWHLAAGWAACTMTVSGVIMG